MTNRSLPQIAKAIKALEKKTIQTVVEIGKLLHEASEQCEHGEFMKWIEQEFSYSHDTSLNYRSAYDLSQNPNCSDYGTWDMSLKTFYLVARLLRLDEHPTAQGEAKAIIRAAKKRRVSSTDALLILKDYQEKHSPPPDDPLAIAPPEPDLPPEPIGLCLNSEMVRQYDDLIKNRKLYEGACELPWPSYFEYRDAHPDECKPLTPDDLAYVGQWTSAGPDPDLADDVLILTQALDDLSFYSADDAAWSKAIKDIGGSIKLQEIIEVLNSVYDEHRGKDSVKNAADRAEAKAKATT